MIETDWKVARYNTGGAVPAIELFPGADVAAWEAASGPAFWNVPTTPGSMVRICYIDTVDGTKSGVYEYRPGVSFTRAADASSTKQLHGAVVSTRTYRNEANPMVTAVSPIPGFFAVLEYFSADDPTQPLGTTTWSVTAIPDVHVAITYNEFLLGMTGIGWSPVAANWNGSAPANFGEALNRLAAHLGPIP